MAKLSIVAGATSISDIFYIQDSSSTTGDGLTGINNTSSGLAGYYTFAGANAGATSITFTSINATSAYTSGGIVEISATNMKGAYRIDLPNAMFATGKGRSVTLHLHGVTNMANVVTQYELTGWDNQDAVHGGLSALPNTAVTTNASLLTSGTGTDQLSVSSGKVDAGKINGVSTSSVTTVNANIGTTQPENFTGTGGSALVKVDVVDISGSAVSATSAQLGVNVVQMNAVSTSSVTTINANQGTTQPINFHGTSTTAYVKSDLTEISDAAISTTAAQLGVNAVQINAVSTSSVTTINANVGTTQPTNFTGTAGAALVKADTVDIAGAAISTTSAQIGVNVVNFGGAAGTFASGRPEVDFNSGSNTELSAVPSSTAKTLDMLKWMFLLARNKLTQTSSTTTVLANDNSTSVSTSTISDDGTTFTRGKFS